MARDENWSMRKRQVRRVAIQNQTIMTESIELSNARAGSSTTADTADSSSPSHSTTIPASGFAGAIVFGVLLLAMVGLGIRVAVVRYHRNLAPSTAYKAAAYTAARRHEYNGMSNRKARRPDLRIFHREPIATGKLSKGKGGKRRNYSIELCEYARAYIYTYMGQRKPNGRLAPDTPDDGAARKPDAGGKSSDAIAPETWHRTLLEKQIYGAKHKSKEGKEQRTYAKKKTEVIQSKSLPVTSPFTQLPSVGPAATRSQGSSDPDLTKEHLMSMTTMDEKQGAEDIKLESISVSTQSVDPEEERKLLHKQDRRILVIVSLLYLFACTSSFSCASPQRRSRRAASTYIVTAVRPGSDHGNGRVPPSLSPQNTLDFHHLCPGQSGQSGLSTAGLLISSGFESSDNTGRALPQITKAAAEYLELHRMRLALRDSEL
ncbi:hypothetical protein B0H13DRAFT_1851016 [Mycena leptocephala]|nr:hypothetical protein B0H13DRAFT_1851016 [Mycena leptocephala]